MRSREAIYPLRWEVLTLAAGETRIIDSPGKALWLAVGVGTVSPQEISIQVGDTGDFIDFVEGLFLRSSGFGRVHVRNNTGTTKSVRLLITDDPNFIVNIAVVT